ncbi:MAG: DNRLRE domain-containing protein [Streptomyces sp.]|nr:DNRLRE domain-containing protein [Streptomyces sp.]
MVASAATVVGEAGMAVAVTPERPAAAAKAPKAPQRGPAEAADLASARLAALLQKRRIEVLSERTADSSTFVEPNGTLTTEAYAGPVRVRQADGSWQAIDTDLAAAGSRFRPRHATADVAVSDGGDTDLASVTSGARTFGLRWPSALPAPKVHGNTAAYDIGGGATLTVQALAQGFEQSVVLASAPAGPVSYRIPLTLKGLALSKDAATGRLMLKDAAGKLVAQAEAPHMWDSSKNPASGEPEHQAEVATRVEKAADGSTVLVLTPDPAFFAQGLTYPVTIDPSSTLAVTTDTWVQTPDYPDSQLGSQELKSGTYDSGSDIARSYLKFDVSKFAGRHVLSAQMSLYSYYSSTCTTTGPGTQAKRVTSALDTTSITWAAQPSTTTANMATNTGHWGYSSACPANWSRWTLTGMVQDWANGAANYGIQVRSADEGDATTWRRFRSANYATSGYAPQLVVNYNSYPGQGTAVSPASGTATSDTTPTLQAKATDPDGDKLAYHFEVWNSAGTTMVANGDSAQVSSGATGSWTAPALAQGAYKWRMLARDGTDGSKSWSAWSTLTVDTTAPGTTAASSADFPAGAWSGTADADGNFSGAFTFTPPSSDVAAVVWNLDGGAVHTDWTTGAAVKETIGFRAGKHTVGVRTQDKAGNTSALTSYVFYAGAGAALLTPGAGERPARRAVLTGQGKATETGVTYQYRRGETDTWHDVPAADVTVTASGAALAAWPAAAPGGVPASLTWNITDTLAEDGPVDVRAVFTDGTTPDNSPANTVTVDRNAGSAPTVNAGPAEVNALTGDATLSETDASVFDLGVTRTASSRRPANGAQQQGQVAIFGPQWTAGTTADITESSWSYIRQTSATSVALVDVDGQPTGFTAVTGGGWKPEPGAEELSLTGSPTSGAFTLKDTDGTTAVFTRPAGAVNWTLSSTTTPTDDSATTVVPDAVQSGGAVRPKYVIAPTSAATAAQCTASPATRGCRVLEYVYAGSTTATSSAFGDFAGQVSQIRLWATGPGEQASTATAVAAYAYDSLGRLRQEWDPRTSPALKTGYDYDSAGRITAVTPPGELPWTLVYGKAGTAATAGDGMLLSVSRPTLAQGSTSQTDGGDATTSLVYNVPLTGGSAPYAMGATDVAAWGQGDVPADATALFPADQVPASHDGSALAAGAYGRATLTYTDASGREVDTVQPGGRTATTEYDTYGHIVRRLTAADRELALATGGSGLAELQQLGIDGLTPADRAQQLSSTSVYNTASVAADAGTDKDTDPANTGQRLVADYGPLHLVTLAGPLHAAAGGTDLAAGSVVPARQHTVTAYDQGRPTDGSATVQNQVTSVTVGAAVDGYPADADTRTTTTAYDWAKGLPVRKVIDPDGLKLATTTAYDGQGRVTRLSLPKSGGSDAGTTVTTYWSATGTGPCAGHPEWADLLCSTAPAGAITGGGANPAQLPTRTVEYDRWGSDAKVTEVSGSVTRTTTSTYDPAGRPVRTSVTGGTGTAVPDTVTGYDPATGDVATITAGGRTVSRGYDALGRETSYSDGAGNTATTAYDALNRPVRTTDSAPSTTTYAYDTAKDPRGLETSRTDSVAGTIGAAYDADGKLATQSLPGGYTLAVTRDETGAPTSRIYTRDSDGLTLATDAAGDTVHGQEAVHASDTGAEGYTYDAAGRLTHVDDTRAGVTTHRTYGFDDDTNRTSLTTATDNPDGTAGSPSSTAYTYDSADRLTTVGGTAVTYDAFGRTTVQANGTTTGYYTDDLVHDQTAGGTRTTWTLDAAQRLASWTTESRGADGTWTQSAARTNHYGDDSDSPSWTQEDAATITRDVKGSEGDLDAVTGAAGGTVLQLTDLHGDVSVQLPLDTAQAPVVMAWDEYGNAETDTAGAQAARYGWTGAKERSAETASGDVLMGVRLFDQQTGRFLSVDPVPGGSADAYDFCGADPVNCYDLGGRWWGSGWWKKVLKGLVVVLIRAAVEAIIDVYFPAAAPWADEIGNCIAGACAGFIFTKGSWKTRAGYALLGCLVGAGFGRTVRNKIKAKVVKILMKYHR